MVGERFILSGNVMDDSITDYQNPGNARFDQNVVDFLASPIPEPTSFALFAIGLTGLASACCRRPST
jgi:PEP-CTERM motif